jgi:hypothetical protein
VAVEVIPDRVEPAGAATLDQDDQVMEVIPDRDAQEDAANLDRDVLVD